MYECELSVPVGLLPAPTVITAFSLTPVTVTVTFSVTVEVPSNRETVKVSTSDEHTAGFQTHLTLAYHLLLITPPVPLVLESCVVTEAVSVPSAPAEALTAVTVWVSARSTSLNFFFNDPATTEIYALSLHDALPILPAPTVITAFSLTPVTVTVTFSVTVEVPSNRETVKVS